MAFLSKVGNLLKQAASRPVNSELRVSRLPIFQAIRCMSSFSSSKVFIGGLSYGTDDQSLREAFCKYGEVIEARIIMDRETGRSRGFGFVTFTSSEEASSAIQALDGQDLHGRRVKVNYATDRAGPNRSFEYGAPGGYAGSQGGYGARGGYDGTQDGYAQSGYGGAQGGYAQAGYGGAQGGYAQAGYGGAQGGYASGQADHGAAQGGPNSSQAGYSASGGSYGSGFNAGGSHGGSADSNPWGGNNYVNGGNSGGVGVNSYGSGDSYSTDAGSSNAYASESAGSVSSFTSGGYEGSTGVGFSGNDQFGSTDNGNMDGDNGRFGHSGASEGNYGNDSAAEYTKAG